MRILATSIALIFRRDDSRKVILLATFSFLFLLLAINNGLSAFQILGFDSLATDKRVGLAIKSFFDFSTTFRPGSLVLAFLGSFIAGINLSLAYTYIRLRGELLVKSNLYSGFGLFLAIIGVGCAACGTAVLSLLLGMFGFSALLGILPYEGLEIGYAGLIILMLATYALAKKIGEPNVC